MLRLHKTRIYALLKVGKTVWVSSEEGHIYIVNTKVLHIGSSLVYIIDDEIF